MLLVNSRYKLIQFGKVKALLLFVFLSVISTAWAIMVSGFDIPDGQAIAVVKSLAEAGNAKAQAGLGGYYASRDEYKKAIPWLEKAAKGGYIGANALLGDFYLEGQGVKQNILKGLALLQEDAAQGSAFAYNELGAVYSNGILVKKDMPKAVTFFKKSMALDYAPAYFNMGEVYFYGKIEEPNIQKGLALFKESALKGYPYAQYKLTFAYVANKFGIKLNFQKAIKWFFVSQINGQEDTEQMGPIIEKLQQTAPYCIAQAQIGVAAFYEQGVAGLPQSLHQAMQWLIKANQLSPDLAQVQLPIAAFSLRHGHDALAYQHAVLAAKQPFGNAQQFLGMLYQKGLGVDKDLVKASAWYQMALYTYAHPASDFYNQFVKACRPSTAPTETLNSKTAQQQLALLNQQLNASQQQAAKELYEKLKAEQADSIEKFIKVNSGSH